VKAVLDTSIFVSAFALPSGQAAKAILHAIGGRFELAISKPVIHELLGVLARNFDRDPEPRGRQAR